MSQTKKNWEDASVYNWENQDNENWKDWFRVTTFASNWENILDKMTSVLRTEFKNTLPVYIGKANDRAGSQYLQLKPTGSELLNYAVKSETRDFSVNMFLYCGKKNDSRITLDAILHLTSRVEALMHDNVAMTLSDNSNLFNCRMESTTLNAGDEDMYIVEWEWKGMHMGNIG